MRKDERGLTIVELLIAISIFSVVSASMYTLVFSLRRSSEQTRSIAQVSQEARRGLNRMVRDTREGDAIVAIDNDLSDNRASYTVQVDFDANNAITTSGVNGSGDAEQLTYEFNRSAKTLTLNGEILMRGVDCLSTCVPFTYSSSRFQYDWNADGIVTWGELDEAGCAARGSFAVGNCDLTLNVEMSEVGLVDYAFKVVDGTSTESFYAQAQMRNKR